MKEYDLDSYNRKWRQTFGFFRYEDGTLAQGMFQEFFPITKTQCGVTVNLGRDKLERYALEEPDPDKKMKFVKIEYHPLDSGWYLHKNGAGLLTRLHVRGFQVGLTFNNHALYCVDGHGDSYDSLHRWHLMNFQKRPKFTQYNPAQHFGILNERLWWRGDQLFFLNRTIGFFKDKVLSVENSAFIPFIKPYLGDECQINS